MPQLRPAGTRLHWVPSPARANPDRPLGRPASGASPPDPGQPAGGHRDACFRSLRSREVELLCRHNAPPVTLALRAETEQFMIERWKPDLGREDVTPKAYYCTRREIIAGSAALGIASTLPQLAEAEMLKPNALRDIIKFNNFIELGMGKTDPAKNADLLKTEPWSVEIDGLVETPGRYSLEDLIGESPVEERIYRLRCVEAWSKVVPWNGFELRGLLDRVGVKPDARYVAFETFYRPSELPRQNSRAFDWPYREALRLDEALNPLTLLATGFYGEPLRPQNGAPIRLVVPWKYGFKSIKSMVRISLTKGRPFAFWNSLQPDEYGFLQTSTRM